MGFLRGSAFVIVSVLLFISFLGAGFFYMVSMSLDYDVVKGELVSNTEQMVREMGVYDNFVDNFAIMEEYCSGNSIFSFESDYGIYDIPCEVVDEGEDNVVSYILGDNVHEELEINIRSNYGNLVGYCAGGDVFDIDYEGNNFEVPCEVINQGADEVFNYALEDFVMRGYSAEYDCSLLKCWEETKSPSFLISEKTRNYAIAKLSFLIFASLILIGLMFVLIEKRSSLPFVVGGLLIVVSLPFMKLDSALSFIDDKLVLSFVSIFLTQTYSVFVRFMAIGVGVVTLGIILKFFLIGFRVNSFVKWIKRKLEERKKEKKSKEKGLIKGKKGESIWLEE